ncbi:MAG: hypothetical protein IJH79_17705 [Lentisphaeria bacterium]|nr:hypothetical protein [Lentisphaeria bacterium]
MTGGEIVFAIVVSLIFTVIIAFIISTIKIWVGIYKFFAYTQYEINENLKAIREIWENAAKRQ